MLTNHKSLDTQRPRAIASRLTRAFSCLPQ